MHFFNYLCFNYLCLKLYNLGWRCSWGSSLPYRRRLPSQSGSSALLAGSLLLTATGLPPRWWKTWWCSSAICDCWETCLLCEKPTCFALFDFNLIFNIYVLTSANQFWFEKTTFGLPASGSGSQMSSESYSSSFGLCVSVFLFFCLFACLS